MSSKVKAKQTALIRMARGDRFVQDMLRSIFAVRDGRKPNQIVRGRVWAQRIRTPKELSDLDSTPSPGAKKR